MSVISNDNDLLKISVKIPLWKFMTELKDDDSFSLFDFVDDYVNGLAKQGKISKKEEYYWNNHSDVDFDYNIIPASSENGFYQTIEFIYYFDLLCGYINYERIENGNEFQDFCLEKKSGHNEITDHEFIEYDVENE